MGVISADRLQGLAASLEEVGSAGDLVGVDLLAELTSRKFE